MKKVNFLYTLIVLFVFATAFKFASSDYKVVPQESKVAWLAKKVTGQHHGTVTIKNGGVTVDGKALKGGNLEIDMSSIICEDLKDEGYNKKLVNHLKSDDFFGVEKYPTSRFEITSVKPIANAEAGKPNYELTGKLTIKATTNQVVVPALVVITKDIVSVKTNFKIDRSKYDVRYGSPSFFNDLGDKAIYDEFEMDLDLVAKK